MSHRPNNAKKIRQLRRELRRRPLPAYIDLVTWLKDRKHAQTTGEAEKIILAGRVRADSHKLGITKQPVLVGNKVEEREVVQRLVSAEHRRKLRVVEAKA